jgi:hypothetical protein
MQVLKDIAGSHVVVYLTEGHDPAYIDVQKDAREPGMSFIELVSQGHVRYEEVIRDDLAPERIVQIMKAWAAKRVNLVTVLRAQRKAMELLDPSLRRYFPMEIGTIDGFRIITSKQP